MSTPLKIATAICGLTYVLVAPAEATQAPKSQPKEVVVHDPSMAREGKTFYVFSTGHGIPFYS